MHAIGIFRFEVGDKSGRGIFKSPSAFFEIEDSQPPVFEKIFVEFFKDGDHDSDYMTIKMGYELGKNRAVGWPDEATPGCISRYGS